MTEAVGDCVESYSENCRSVTLVGGGRDQVGLV